MVRERPTKRGIDKVDLLDPRCRGRRRKVSSLDARELLVLPQHDDRTHGDRTKDETFKGSLLSKAARPWSLTRAKVIAPRNLEKRSCMFLSRDVGQAASSASGERLSTGYVGGNRWWSRTASFE